MVYYDILGYTFISYTELTGKIWNIIIPLLSVILSYYVLHTKGIPFREVLKEIGFSCLVTLLSFILGGVVCLLIAYILDLCGKTMSWYYCTYFSIALYCLPTLAINSFFYARLVRKRDSPLSLALQTQAHLIGVNLVYAAGSFLLSLGYRTAYVFMVPCIVTLIVNAIIGLTKSQNASKSLYENFRLNVFFY